VRHFTTKGIPFTKDEIETWGNSILLGWPRGGRLGYRCRWRASVKKEKPVKPITDSRKDRVSRWIESYGRFVLCYCRRITHEGRRDLAGDVWAKLSSNGIKWPENSRAARAYLKKIAHSCLANRVELDKAQKRGGDEDVFTRQYGRSINAADNEGRVSKWDVMKIGDDFL